MALITASCDRGARARAGLTAALLALCAPASALYVTTTTGSPWGISLLQEELRSHHVQAAAFHSNRKALEVLDVNGVQHQVAIFPSATPMLVDAMRQERVAFSVAPEPAAFPVFYVAVIRAMLLTVVVIALIDALGMMDDFIFGCILVGSSWLQLMRELDALLITAWRGAELSVADGEARHREALAALARAVRSALGVRPQADPIPIRVEEGGGSKEEHRM